MDYESLATEGRSALTTNMDEMSAREIVDAMNEMDEEVILAVRGARSEIARAVEAAAEAIKSGGRVIYLGAGTSGRLGVLDASECPPTFGVSDNLFVGIIAGGDRALRHSVENAEDSPEQGAQALRELGVGANDFVVAISASGSAPYCIGALTFAREAGAKTAAMVCNPGSSMADIADIAIELITGPEALSGSTRLKAGTATKMALNMISTGAMALTGKTYENLMVDVRASNKKLVDRCVRIVMRAAHVTRPEAESLIQRANGDLKTAIVMSLSSVTCEEAKRALAAADGHVKRSIKALEHR